MYSYLYSTRYVVVVARVFLTHARVGKIVFGELELGHRNAVEAVCS